MRKILTRGLFAVLLVGMIGGVANAEPIKTEINLTADASIGCSVGGVDTLGSAYYSNVFTIPATGNQMGYLLSVYFRDTVAAAAVAADSVFFRLARAPENVTVDLDSTQVAAKGDGWIAVYTFAGQQMYGLTYPISKHIPMDSSGVYPIGPGVYKWIVFGGKAAANHYPGKAYKFDAYIESAERY